MLNIAVVGGGPAGLPLLSWRSRPTLPMPLMCSNRTPRTQLTVSVSCWPMSPSTYSMASTLDCFSEYRLIAEDPGPHRYHPQGNRNPLKGNGFMGISRVKLPQLMQQNARERAFNSASASVSPKTLKRE